MTTEKTVLGTLYTLTPLHMGAGQAAGAIDLPVAREQHTGLPIVPSSALKGVWRDIFESNNIDQKIINDIFGPEIESTEKGEGSAGSLIFSEGQNLALPFRSTAGPFLYCTSPMVLERLVRCLRAFGVSFPEEFEENLKKLDSDRVYVAGKEQAGKPLLVEDMLFPGDEVYFSELFTSIITFVVNLLPDKEEATRTRVAQNLVLLPDQEYLGLVDLGLPVQARVKLTTGKTASRYQGEKGNLWYEENVPADSLFVFFLQNRPGSSMKNPVQDFLSTVRSIGATSKTIQLGGNETVGHGWCWCNLPQSGEE